MLADTFLTNFSERHGVPKKSVTAEVVQYLQSQHWPGNIRQLQHAIERAAIFADGPSITLANCGYAVSSTQSASGGGYAPLHAQREKATRDVRVAKERAESELIVEAMQRLKGNKKRVAEELGVSRSYLYKRLNELSIE